MSTAQTVLEYIQALKWPVVVGGIAFLLRKSIKRAAENFKMPGEGSVKVPGVAEVTWKQDVNQVAAQIEAIEEGAPSVHPRSEKDHAIDPDSPEAIEIVMKYSGLRDDAWEAIDRAVISDPTASVLGSWAKVEDTVYAVARDRMKYVELRRPTVPKIVEYLDIPEDLKLVIRDLRRLRNEAAHGQARIDSSVALTYVQNSKRIVVLLTILFPG